MSIVYFWGSGERGQTLAHFFDSNHPVAYRVPRPLSNQITSIASGGSHTLCLTSSSSLLVCGNNAHGQLGIPGATPTTPLERTPTPPLQHVLQVSAGWSHSIALASSSGHPGVYSWGSNLEGELGVHTPRKQTCTPLLIPPLANIHIVQISCGVRHSAAVSDTGLCFTWGSNKHAQCGHPTPTSYPSPLKLDFDQPVVHVSLGQYHSSVVTQSSSIWMFGSNKYGQCALNPSLTSHWRGKSAPVVPTPKLVPLQLKRPTVYCGWNHTLVLSPTHPHQLWSFGRNNYGQLGLNSTLPSIWQPTPISYLSITHLTRTDSILQVASGSEHCLLLTTNHHVYSWGWNEHGQLGLQDQTDRLKPTRITSFDQHPPIHHIFCGYGCSFAISLPT